MTNYELTYIISPDRAEFEAQKVEATIHEAITKHGGNLISHDFWGKQQLAYHIGKHEFGYYATVIFAVEPEEIEEFLKDFQLMPEIMRHLLISLDKEKIKLADVKKMNPFTDKAPIASTKTEVPTKKTVTKKPEAPKKDEATRMKELDEKLEDILKEE
jgi:small subunit ribosomal protein S6